MEPWEYTFTHTTGLTRYEDLLTLEDIPVFNMLGAMNKHIHFTFYYHEVKQEVLPHGFE